MSIWDEKRRWVEDKIQQAEDAEAALKAGSLYHGMDPKEVIVLSLRIAAGDCREALGDRDTPAFLRKWFFDTQRYCEAMLKEWI